MQALPRQLVKCGSALRVARLLCALPWGTADGPSRNMLIYAAGVLGGLLEAEWQAPTQQQQQQQRQHRRQQQPGTALEQLLLSEQQLLEACTLAMHVVDSMPMVRPWGEVSLQNVERFEWVCMGACGIVECAPPKCSLLRHLGGPVPCRKC